MEFIKQLLTLILEIIITYPFQSFVVICLWRIGGKVDRIARKICEKKTVEDRGE